jgi:hypothetical protein
MTTRRDFLKLTAAAGAAAVLPGSVQAKESTPAAARDQICYESVKWRAYYGNISLRKHPDGKIKPEMFVRPQPDKIDDPGTYSIWFKDLVWDSWCDSMGIKRGLLPVIRMKHGQVDNAEYLFDGIQWELQHNPTHDFLKHPYCSSIFNRFCWLWEDEGISITTPVLTHGTKGCYWGIVQAWGEFDHQGQFHFRDVFPIQDSNLTIWR